MQRAIVALLAVIVGLLAVLVYQQRSVAHPLRLTAPYHAVVLTNGQVYYGKLEDADVPFPVLRDVYYASNQVNAATKEVNTVMVRRGKELHGPAYMVLNRQAILFIEPVGADSQIGRFVADQTKAAP